jgi:protein-S-isoprenylcysteine O-methyltransferase Ste14
MMTEWSPDATARARMPFRARLEAVRDSKLFDLLAASPVIAWMLVSAHEQLPALLHALATADFASADALLFARIASKGATLIFVFLLLVLLPIRRVPQRRTQGLFPRLAAIAGSYLGVAMLLLPERELGWGVHLASALLILTGMAFSLYALSRLGRSISILPEARRLVTDGPYAVIRHPLYLGEAVMLVGVSLQYVSVLAVLLLALQFAFQCQRMKFEERVLAGAFPDYASYRARTARLVPGIY